MEKEEPFIKITRSFFSRLYNTKMSSHYRDIYLYLIYQANWADSPELKRGQCKNSINEISKNLNMEWRTVKKNIKKLITDGAIEVENSSLITIKTYEKIQGFNAGGSGKKQKAYVKEQKAFNAEGSGKRQKAYVKEQKAYVKEQKAYVKKQKGLTLGVQEKNRTPSVKRQKAYVKEQNPSFNKNYNNYKKENRSGLMAPPPVNECGTRPTGFRQYIFLNFLRDRSHHEKIEQSESRLNSILSPSEKKLLHMLGGPDHASQMSEIDLKIRMREYEKELRQDTQKK